MHDASLRLMQASCNSLLGIGLCSAHATTIAVSWEADPCVDSVSLRVLRRLIGYEAVKPSDLEIASEVYFQVPRLHWSP